MATTTPSRTDLMYEIVYNPDFAPLPSPKANVKTTTLEGKLSYLMKNHATGIYYDFDELTYQIWSLVDGKRTVKEIVKEVQRQTPKIQERTVLEILLFFAESNLLVSSLELAPKKRFKVVSAFEIDFTIVKDSNRFFQSLRQKLKPVLKRPLLLASLVFIIIGTVLFAGEFVSIFGKKSNFEILGSSVVGFFFYYFVALAPVIAIHEIAHGLALAHYNGKPGEMGTGLFYFGPMFYTETTDAWGLSRRDRIMVYLAGNITTLSIGASLVFIRLFVSFPQPASLIVTMVAFYCFDMSLFNFAPPFETDGYYILSDIVNIPNLRRDSYGYVGSILKRVFGKRAKDEIFGLNKRKKRILLIYAILSVTWIIYIIFQTSLFLTYMGQDVTIALLNIAQAVLSSQALPISAVIIALASVAYFGMQIVGYGFLFSAAVKKATAKPIQVEAIHDRDLAVFTYLPPQTPESLSNVLKAKMEKAAKKFTSNFKIIQNGRSFITVLRMGGTSLAQVQIKEHLGRVESAFSSAYQDLILKNNEILQKSAGIYSPNKIKLTTTLDQIAADAVDAGNSRACSIVDGCKKEQNTTLLYLLSSAFGTVWTIEVQPAQEYEIQKELLPGSLLEDITFTDLYGDTENFKKRVIYGFDSLAQLASEIDVGIKESLHRPDEYQLIGVLEPIKGRIVFVGRTEAIESSIQALATLFIAQTWSGYLDNILNEASFALSAATRSHLPSVSDIKGMSNGELAVLTKELHAFAENRDSVEECTQKSETCLMKTRKSLSELENTLSQSGSAKISLLDTIFRVNTENMEKLSGRIREFQKNWKAICKRIEKVQEQIEKEYDKRKPQIAGQRSKMLKTYPIVTILSMVLFVLGFQLQIAMWQISFISAAVILQAIYWAAYYQKWKSSHKVTKYPNQAFSATQLFMLASTEAVYRYVTTGDILTLI